MFTNGGTAVVEAQPEDPDLRIGRPIAFHPEITPPPPPRDRLYTGHPYSAKPGIGRPTANQSPSVHGKDTSKPRATHSGERRWYVGGCSGRNSHGPKMISKEFTSVLRSDPKYHDVDGTCVWMSDAQKVRKKASED